MNKRFNKLGSPIKEVLEEEKELQKIYPGY